MYCEYMKHWEGEEDKCLWKCRKVIINPGGLETMLNVVKAMTCTSNSVFVYPVR